MVRCRAQGNSRICLFSFSLFFMLHFFALFHFSFKQVWGKSGKKGVYPLLFVNDEFLADVCILLLLFFSISTQTIPLFFHHMFFFHTYTQFDEMRDLNEEGELKAKIN